MITKENVETYFKTVCEKEKVQPVKIKFKKVSKGGACVEYLTETKEILNVQFDLDRIYDIELAILHEISHLIMLNKHKNPNHDAKFNKTLNKLIEKYTYSELSFKLFK